ncbi:MAG: division/cell wall cluster transcriptional repressor MraZ [Kiloniellaceae bacterium]
MAVFVGTFHNKVDRKGRVSVPAQFRQNLAGQSFHGIVALPSHRVPAIDVYGFDFIDRLNDSMAASMDFYSESQDDLATTIFGDSQMLPFDGEGRVILPPELAEHAGITDRASFVGKGQIFQIWQPEALKRHKEEARARVRSQGVTLPLRPPGGGGS